MISRAEAHVATGMKPREIVDIEEVDGGYRVTTHDDKDIYLENVEVPETADPEPKRDPDEVPDGSERDVLAWVGDDPERAAAAYVVEQDRDPVRKGLTDKLQKLAG